MLEGRGGWGANPLEFGSDPHHPGGLGSTCGIMCKSVRWTSSLRVRKSGIPNWTKSQPIPKPSWVEYGTNVGTLHKSPVSVDVCVPVQWRSKCQLEILEHF